MASLRKRGRNWFYKFVASDGRPTERKGCSDKRATEHLAREAEADASRQKAGIVDPFARHRNRPIAEHLADFLAFLSSEGATQKHVGQTGSRIRAILDGIGAKRLADLEAAPVSDWLSRQRQGGMTPQTSNHYRTHIKAFSRWLVRHERMARNPMERVGAVNVKADLRHDRGALTAAEFDALIRATMASGALRKLTGADRAMLYTIAAYTGLRASELASLTPASFALDGVPPTVRVKAGYTKNGEEAVLPIRPDLVALLRPYLAGRAKVSRVWPGKWVAKTSLMIRHDMEQAGIPYIDADGRHRDFHALRHRLGSELARANVPPKVAQTLMRHSTITLTMDRYSHVGLHDTAGALEKLPMLTDLDAPKGPISEDFATHLPLGGDVSGRNPSGADGIAASDPVEGGCRNSVVGTDFSGTGRDVTERGAGRIRTGGHGFADRCLTTWLRRHARKNNLSGLARSPTSRLLCRWIPEWRVDSK
jgi:integrase